MKNFNNNSNEESKGKFSKKKVKLIINRIKNIEDEIREIKGRQSSNYLLDNIQKKIQMKKQKTEKAEKFHHFNLTSNLTDIRDLNETNLINNNNTMIATNAIKQNRGSKNKNENGNNNNNYNSNHKNNNTFFYPNLIKDNAFKKKIRKNYSGFRGGGDNTFKKLNIYNSNIHEKRNILFKNGSIYAKNKLRNKTKDNINISYNINTSNNNNKENYNNNQTYNEINKENIKTSSRNNQDKNISRDNIYKFIESSHNYSNINNFSTNPKITLFEISKLNDINSNQISNIISTESNDITKNNNTISQNTNSNQNINININDEFTNTQNMNINNNTNNIHSNYLISQNSNNMNQLDYEFEERYLLKKIKALKSKNAELLNKINSIKNENLTLEKKYINQIQHEQKIIKSLVKTLKANNINNNNSGYKSIDTNYSNPSEINYNYKDILLNLMEVKYDYENNIMVNQFISGLKEYLKIVLGNKTDTNANNEYNYYYDSNIIKNINSLLDMKNNLSNANNKYKYLFEKNNKYYEFCTNFLSYLNLDNINDLEEFIQNIMITNIKENERMKQIKNTLMNENNNSICTYSPVEEKLFSSKIKPFSISCDNYSNKNKNLTYKQFQRYLIETNSNYTGKRKRNINSINNSVNNNKNNSICSMNKKNIKYNSIIYDKKSKNNYSLKDINDIDIIPVNGKIRNYKVLTINKENKDNNENYNKSNINNNDFYNTTNNRSKKKIMLKKDGGYNTHNNNNHDSNIEEKDILAKYIKMRNILKNEDDIQYLDNAKENNNNNNRKLTISNNYCKHVKYNSAYDIGFLK